jgi:peptidoglycan/xylan/chitin deacetylase (PgdA/CDA1 family)
MLLLSGFAVVLFLFIQMKRSLGAYESDTGFVSVSEPDTARLEPPRIFKPSNDGIIYSNSVSISGEAEANRIVSLSVNGVLRSVALPRGRKFHFEDIRLHRGQNRLEVRALTPEGQGSVLETLLITYEHPTISYLTRDFKRGSRTKKTVALTFDGGSTNNAAEEILNILKEEGVHCTFFLTGEFIRRYPETVKRICAENHEVGNHTWGHPHLTTFEENRRHQTLAGMTEKILKTELQKAASLYQMVTGAEMAPLWRAPFGEYNKEILLWAARAGYRHVGWTTGRGWNGTMDTMDWVADRSSSVYHSADEIVEKILRLARGDGEAASGAVILMHLGTNRKDDFPHRKLPDIIQGLEAEGYKLCTVTEMMADAGL